MKIALLTAGINADNAGDSFIEDSIKRLLEVDSFYRYPLTTPLTDSEINSINNCDQVIICGTNLYQTTFACNLNLDVLNRIKIPIIPFGVGISSNIGTIPKMNKEGVKTIQEIHKRIKFSSVRDKGSLKFLHSIGIKNVILTGCPVLFHSLKIPSFQNNEGNYNLSIRSRLLHINDKWNLIQEKVLEYFCNNYKPKLIIQSPYDFQAAQELKKKYSLEIIYDEKWQTDIYIQTIMQQKATFGFRLHYGMLSLSYGKPAYFIAHDSRISEFCEMMQIPYYDIQNLNLNKIKINIDNDFFYKERFINNWIKLSIQMNTFINSIGIKSNLENYNLPKIKKYSFPSIYPKKIEKSKPKILLLVDSPNWAYDNSAKQIVRYLRNEFNFTIKYVLKKPKINPNKYDLLYLFFWGEKIYKDYRFNSDKIIKELSSHRWMDSDYYGPCTTLEMKNRYLRDTNLVICTSKRLLTIIKDYHPRAMLTSNGFDHSTFYNLNQRSGAIKIGWAGNINDDVKGYSDILIPSCKGNFKIITAEGKTPHKRMNEFYNSIDVFVIASKHEGEPLTLIEAMASGCFPVCNNIGIVPELIKDKENGIIVTERTPEAYYQAFEWCQNNIEFVRGQGAKNALKLREERSWEVCSEFFKIAFYKALEYKNRLKFRNDDVSWDTNFKNFRLFCDIFRKHNLIQLHGITLNGSCNTLYLYNNLPVEYENIDNISTLDNITIINLSEGKKFEYRTEIIDYLNKSDDEIALHGLYHTDYSNMTKEGQYKHIIEGLEQLELLFPQKNIRFFIPPFNRYNNNTVKICNELNLEILDNKGIHLEAELDNLSLNISNWYRYHHHRFYPESKFTYYKLNLENLDLALYKALSVFKKQGDYLKY